MKYSKKTLKWSEHQNKKGHSIEKELFDRSSGEEK